MCERVYERVCERVCVRACVRARECDPVCERVDVLLRFSGSSLARVGIVECLPFRSLFSHGTLPTREWSSDHMALIVDLAWR